jgi:hypothetical protein
MKNKILIRLISFMAIVSLLIACEKTAIEKAQDAYDASKVVPLILGVNGPSAVLETYSYDYSVTYHRAGSNWSWNAEGAVISSVTSDTRGVTLFFDAVPASGKARLTVSETTAGGVKSPEKVIEITVKPFCPLPFSGFEGTWTGIDELEDEFEYDITVTATLSEDSQILVDVIGSGLMEDEDFWGEEIIEGGTFLVTINPDGTLDVPEQFFCDTDLYEGYKIRGSGTWDNCGASPTMTINYDIWFPDPDESFWIADHYFGTDFSATITLGNGDDNGDDNGDGDDGGDNGDNGGNGDGDGGDGK